MWVKRITRIMGLRELRELCGLRGLRELCGLRGLRELWGYANCANYVGYANYANGSLTFAVCHEPRLRFPCWIIVFITSAFIRMGSIILIPLQWKTPIFEPPFLCPSIILLIGTKYIWFGRVPNVNIVSLSVGTLRWCPHFYFEIVTLNLVEKLKGWKEWRYNQVPHSCSLLPYIYYLERPKCCHANIYQGGKVLFRFILMIGWECSSTLLGFAEGVCGRDGSTFTSALLDEVGNGQEEGSGDALRRR